MRPPSARSPAPASTRETLLERLVDELADAHEDTVRLSTMGSSELEWDVHLDYLRAMQRLARESLALG
jgi:hypothetical protein